MRKSTAGIALAATIGFSALSTAPAMAAHLPFPNCTAAEAAGVYNIPDTSPAYGSHLDADDDGFGCDAAGTPPFNPDLVDVHMEAEPEAPKEEQDQVDQVPNGGVDAGVTPEGTSNLGVLALSGGMVLVAAAGGTLLIRRRYANQA